MSHADPLGEAITAPEAPAGVPSVEDVIRARLTKALGGWQGSLEAALPTLAFVIAWTATKDARTALVAAAVVIAVCAVVRLVTRTTLQYVLGATMVTAVAALFIIRSGRAEDAFLPGIIASGVWTLITLVSVLVRWPVMGFLVALGDPHYAEHPFRWREDRGMVAVCARLTLVLFALYLVRVAIMLPLYLAGNVAWLGVTKIALGWPAYLLAVAVMALLLARGHTASSGHLEREVVGQA